MRIVVKPALAFVLVAALCAPLAAQWPSHPAQNVPRLADGKVDMNGATPRLANGKPDLSGVWENVGRGRGEPREALTWDEKPLATFADIGAGFKDGLPLQPWARELLNERKANNSKDNPDVWCLPLGNMQFNTHPFPRKLVHTPGLLIVLYETHQGIRQIFTDGRPLPSNDPNPTWYGYSVGRWDGDTLVVETTGFRDGGWLDIYGSPLTEQGRMIERFRRTSAGQLEMEVTIDDPKAYTRPFTVRLNQRLMPEAEIIEMVCQENNQSIHHLVGKDGPK